jgi:hypothetical protein
MLTHAAFPKYAALFGNSSACDSGEPSHGAGTALRNGVNGSFAFADSRSCAKQISAHFNAVA